MRMVLKRSNIPPEATGKPFMVKVSGDKRGLICIDTEKYINDQLLKNSQINNLDDSPRHHFHMYTLIVSQHPSCPLSYLPQ